MLVVIDEHFIQSTLNNLFTNFVGDVFQQIKIKALSSFLLAPVPHLVFFEQYFFLDKWRMCILLQLTCCSYHSIYMYLWKQFL